MNWTRLGAAEVWIDHRLDLVTVALALHQPARVLRVDVVLVEEPAEFIIDLVVSDPHLLFA